MLHDTGMLNSAADIRPHYTQKSVLHQQEPAMNCTLLGLHCFTYYYDALHTAKFATEVRYSYAMKYLNGLGPPDSANNVAGVGRVPPLVH